LSNADRNVVARSAVYHRLIDRLDAACFEARELEERVHELQQTKRVSLYDDEVVANVGGDVPPIERFLQRPEHERERRAELVAHVRKKASLGPIELGERLGAALLFLERTSVADRRRDLCRQQLEETAIAVVEAQTRAQADDQHARRPMGAIRGYRENDGRRRRVGPRPGRNVGEALIEMIDDAHGAAISVRERPHAVTIFE